MKNNLRARQSDVAGPAFHGLEFIEQQAQRLLSEDPIQSTQP
jgi:hypothetical protein